MDAEKSFRDNRYVYLSGAVSRDNCEKLTDYMFRLFEDGKLEKDPQCPLSDSIYGDPVFDNLAASLAPILSRQLGVEIAPTYTYCRIYRNSELLTRHVDRPSCEISGTMTLGFDDASGIWPIFFAKNEEDVVGDSLEINIGDIVMYRGCELPHWRPKYKGNWQVQVFFHYVDVNGPHKDHIFDGRSKMGLPASEKKDVQQVESPKNEELKSKIIYDGVMITTNDQIFPGLTHFDKNFNPHLAFTEEECKKIISLSDTLYPTKSTVGGDDTRKYDASIREVDTYNIELSDKTKWIFDRIASATGTANRDYYKYNVLGITHSLQLLHYSGDDNGHYDWHIDAGPGSSCTRKISVVVPLNDPQEYEGGVLDVNNNGTLVSAPQTPGTMILFPSFTPHKVNPVTKGNRWSLVSWVHGTDRFK